MEDRVRRPSCFSVVGREVPGATTDLRVKSAVRNPVNGENAVMSNEREVDSRRCGVGMKGSRGQAIIRDLRGRDRHHRWVLKNLQCCSQRSFARKR